MYDGELVSVICSMCNCISMFYAEQYYMYYRYHFSRLMMPIAVWTGILGLCGLTVVLRTARLAGHASVDWVMVHYFTSVGHEINVKYNETT